jgi:hypothetical protein
MPGLALSEMFYEQAAAPILREHFPGLAYSAALIGWGSEVLGYDDRTSTDHNWGRGSFYFFQRMITAHGPLPFAKR